MQFVRKNVQLTDCDVGDIDGGWGARRFLRADRRTGLSIVLILSK